MLRRGVPRKKEEKVRSAAYDLRWLAEKGKKKRTVKDGEFAWGGGGVTIRPSLPSCLDSGHHMDIKEQSRPRW